MPLYERRRSEYSPEVLLSVPQIPATSLLSTRWCWSPTEATAEVTVAEDGNVALGRVGGGDVEVKERKMRNESLEWCNAAARPKVDGGGGRVGCVVRVRLGCR
jgi:hypothetical protein